MSLFHDMMLINPKSGVEVVGSASNSGLTASATLVSNNPTNVSGDYLFSFAIIDTNPDTISMGGWTPVSSDTGVSSSIFRIISNGNIGPTSTVTFTQTSSRDKILMINSFRGVSTLTTGTPTGGALTSLVASSITMPTSGLLLACYLWRSNGGAPAISSTPSNMSLIETRSQGDVAVSTYYQQVSGGSTGTKTLTLSAASGFSHSILIGLT